MENEIRFFNTEQLFQQWCIAWYSRNYFRHRRQLFCVNNNQSKRLSESQKAIDGAMANSMGIVAGVADLVLISFGKVNFIELKLPQGRQSQDQIDFEAICIVNGIPYYLVKNNLEFINTIQSIIPYYGR